MAHAAASSQAAALELPRGGRAGLCPGEKPGWAVETGCLAWLSRGQAMWAPANGAGYYLGAALPCQALLSHPHSLSRSPIQAWHPAAVLQEMPRTYRRAAVGTSQPGAHCSSQAAQLVHQISSKEKDGVEGKTKIQDLTNTK